jgi:hypothetical protein
MCLRHNQASLEKNVIAAFGVRILEDVALPRQAGGRGPDFLCIPVQGLAQPEAIPSDLIIKLAPGLKR